MIAKNQMFFAFNFKSNSLFCPGVIIYRLEGWEEEGENSGRISDDRSASNLRLLIRVDWGSLIAFAQCSLTQMALWFTICDSPSWLELLIQTVTQRLWVTGAWHLNDFDGERGGLFVFSAILTSNHWLLMSQTIKLARLDNWRISSGDYWIQRIEVRLVNTVRIPFSISHIKVEPHLQSDIELWTCFRFVTRSNKNWVPVKNRPFPLSSRWSFT